jgi:glycosyltransferase involved in cell wall biosynthesis
MKELLEGYGLAANSHDIDSIKAQMKRVLLDKEFKAELSEKSLERSFDFSWCQAAIETLAVYEKSIIRNNKA